MSFPIGHTIDRGRYRIDRLLQGEGVQQLYAGTDTGANTPVLVSLDLVPSRIDLRDFRATLDEHAPGVFELGYVGPLDMLPDVEFEEQRSRWALVETVPGGAWLPSVLVPGVETALSLGRSAAELLLGAGVVLPYIRPELMWSNGREITGLTTRPRAMFARTTIDAFSLPLFDRFFHAPEAYKDPDDRAMVFALAIMIAEWATGAFPFKSKYHNTGPLEGKHVKLKVPKPLAALLSRGMRLDRAERPHFAAFLDELRAM